MTRLIDKQKILLLLPSFLLSLLYSFTFGLYAPLDIFISNRSEFWFDLYEFFPPVLVMFLLIFAGMFLINSVIYLLYRKHKKLYGGIILLELALFICLYIDGNFLVSALPEVDDVAVNWDAPKLRRAARVTFLLWGTVFAAAIVFFLKWGGEWILSSLKLITPWFLALMLIALGAETIGKTQSVFYSRIRDDHSITEKNLLQYSRRENFIMLLLDAYDSAYLQKFTKDHPEECEEILEDFTWYQDAMGTYNFTNYAIPEILSGKRYDFTEDFKDYYLEEMSESPLLEELEKRGFKMGIYEEDFPYCNQEAYERLDNQQEHLSHLKSGKALDALFLRIIGFRYLPYGLKKYCTLEMDAISELRERKNNARDDDFDWENYLFYEKVCEEPFDMIDENCFRFIHLRGGHIKYHTDENCVYSEEETTMEQAYLGCLTMIRAFLDKLQENGAYDNAVIIILGDHGERQGEGNIYATNPVLFIKGRQEHHPLIASGAPVAYEDLMGAYFALLSGKKGNDVFSAREGDNRKRMFYWRDDGFLYEFEQTGKAGDMKTFSPTGWVKKYQK